MGSGSAILLHRGNGDLPATQTAVAGTSGDGLSCHPRHRLPGLNR